MPVNSVANARALRMMIGTMIGVGILALPYAVAQVGFVLGVLALGVVGVLSALVLEIYADLVLARGGKARFIHVVGRELGPFGTFVASASFIGGIYGALLAYGIFGGQFLRTLTFSVMPMTPFAATMLFFVLGAFATIGGSLLVARVQRYMVPTFLLLMLVLVLFTIPHIRLEHFLWSAPENLGTSLGIMVFAFFGLSAIPEARDYLGRASARLPHVTGKAVAIVAGVYALFVAAVVGVTGATTTENAISGLRNTLGNEAYLLATTIMFLITLSAFMNVASSLTNTYLFDLRVRFFAAWMLTMSVPLSFVLLGVSSMGAVLSVTGGVLGSLAGITMLLAYERARMSAELSRDSLRIPQFVVGLVFCAFVAILVTTIVG